MYKKTFQTTILGSSGAMPTSKRHNSSQVLQYDNNYFLLDCAEGTQMQLFRQKIPVMKINHVFISHLHGDHYLGLPGLLFSLHLLGRKKDIHVYSPPGLKKIIQMQFRLCKMKTSYKIRYHEIKRENKVIHEDESIKVKTIKMLHSISTYGFVFSEKKRNRNIKKEYVDKYNISVKEIQEIKEGGNYTTSKGDIISNEEITIAPPSPRTYAFCSDTAYTESFIESIKEADTLYHEATFMKDSSDLANGKYHSTTVEAALIAQKSFVNKLIIGHYSARYDDDQLEMYIKEARSVFSATFLAEEGQTFVIA